MRLFTTVLYAILPLALCAPSPTAEDGIALEERARGNTRCNHMNPTYASLVRKRLTQSGVIPTLIPDVKPKVQIHPQYNLQSGGVKKVKLGNRFLTSETTTAPVLKFSAERGFPAAQTNYSIFIVDPDVPDQDNPARMTFLHWYVAHARPPCAIGEEEDYSEQVTAYELPTPLSAQQHRYTFLIYREGPNYVPDVVTAQARPGFDVNSYAEAGGLTLVGANFFRQAVTNMDT